VTGRSVPVQNGVVVAPEHDVRVRRGRIVVRAVLPDAPLLVDVPGPAAFDQISGVRRRLGVLVVLVDKNLWAVATCHEFLERHHDGKALFSEAVAEGSSSFKNRSEVFSSPWTSGYLTPLLSKPFCDCLFCKFVGKPFFFILQGRPFQSNYDVGMEVDQKLTGRDCVFSHICRSAVLGRPSSNRLGNPSRILVSASDASL
jgi:hypothetical protein